MKYPILIFFLIIKKIGSFEPSSYLYEGNYIYYWIPFKACNKYLLKFFLFGKEKMKIYRKIRNIATF